MRLKFSSNISSALYFLLFINIWIFLVPAFAKLNPVLAAEKIKLIYGPFNGSISVHSLKAYAETGEITQEFRLYAKFIDRETLSKLRYWLQKSFSSDRVELYKYSQTAEGEKFLQDLGTAITTHPQRNGFYAIRSALIEAAAAPGSNDGWTAIDVVQKFPTDDIQIDTKKLFKLGKFWRESEASIELD